MNAVAYLTMRLPSEAVRRLAGLPVHRFDRHFDRHAAASVPTLFGPAPPARPATGWTLTTDLARLVVIERWREDLCGLLNALQKRELVALAEAIRVREAPSRSPALRAALWAVGAGLERGGHDAVASTIQPRPLLLGGHLVLQAPPRGMHPPALTWPRPVPPPAIAAPPPEEPDSLDELLAAADRAVGVRLGPRGSDKGAWGLRAAALLGVVERGLDEPDWRGDVEVKTIAVAQEPAGHWRVVEDPAIAMVASGAPGGGALAKLQRTLWLSRATLDGGDATIVSWYLLDWDLEVARLTRRYLHTRPKGPAGTDQRGWYLHKRFFADAGLLASLNGW